MFSAEPESPSFVEKAITSGRPFRRCAFAAIVTAVSVTPFASFARVFPRARRNDHRLHRVRAGRAVCLGYGGHNVPPGYSASGA